jgi:hypothetical protein
MSEWFTTMFLSANSQDLAAKLRTAHLFMVVGKMSVSSSTPLGGFPFPSRPHALTSTKKHHEGWNLYIES